MKFLLQKRIPLPRIERFYFGLLAAMMLACFARPALAQDTVRATGDYETPAPVNAEDFLPKSTFAGKKLFVERTAQNNGLQNTYRIRAGSEQYEITGSEAALQFWQELRAISQLRQISTAKAVTRGLSQSAKATYQTGRQIVRDPIGAVKKVPQGASRFFGKVKDFFSEDEEDTRQKASVGETIKGFLGIDEEKRKLAARLGVDVYSRNEALQKELDRVASAMAGGGLALNIGTMPIGGAVGIGLTAIGIEQTVDSLINESSPDELRKWNEQNLTKLGAKPDVITQFLNHPWYTPRQETIITASLRKANVDPNLFFESANKALTEEDGRYFQHVAQLLAAYSEKVAPLQSLRLEDGVLCALDRNGVLVVPVSFDYAIWTETVAQRADALASLVSSDQNIKSAKIWTDGKLSDRLKAELDRRSIGYAAP
ncbi:MAG: hypothetical protein WB586_04830 [Chthoniobacterales bacterium]